jgi:hypothetical protein
MPPEPTSLSVSAPDDPLTIAMQPSPNESPEERKAREMNETAAKLRSDTIDEYLKGFKKAKVTKLLLLGLSAFLHLLLTTC